MKGLLVLILAVIPSVSIAESRFGAHMLSDRMVRGYLEELMELADHFSANGERAAFLTASGEGYQCLLWPASGSATEASYTGSIPPGTVAIVHTHPYRWPMASSEDVRVSVRLKIPIVVLTPQHIYMVDWRNGRNVAVLTGEIWTRQVPRQPCQTLP